MEGDRERGTHVTQRVRIMTTALAGPLAVQGAAPSLAQGRASAVTLASGARGLWRGRRPSRRLPRPQTGTSLDSPSQRELEKPGVPTPVLTEEKEMMERANDDQGHPGGLPRGGDL